MKPCDLFKAMADETRLRILVMLTEHELCVNELEKILKLSQSNVSRHLSKLQSVHLVTSRRAAQHIYYRLDKHLAENWSPLEFLLLSLKKHPEFEMDFAALEAHQESGSPLDYGARKVSLFSEDDLI